MGDKRVLPVLGLFVILLSSSQLLFSPQETYAGGFFCNPGDFDSGGGCFPCPAGSFCTGGTAMPLACPEGTTSPPGAFECVLSVFLVEDDDDGGDCEDEGIGKWNDKTKTCRLTIDLDGGDRIIMGEDDITLNCNGHLLDGDGSGGDGISLVDRSGVTIRNCHVTDYDIGIHLETSEFNTLQGNNAFLNDDEGIFLEDMSDNNTLQGNTANENGFSGIHLDDAHFNKLSKNTANGNVIGIFIFVSDDNTLIGNTANGNDLDGIRILNSDNNTLNGNTANGNNFGIGLNDSNDNTLNGNTANGNNFGIVLLFSDGNTLNGNTANGINFGIFLVISDGNTLIGNTANGNNSDGIRILNSDNNTLNGNTAFKNLGTGFFLDSVSGGNTLEDNDAKNNSDLGFGDLSLGVGTAETANTYTDNKCAANGDGGSDPTGLCSPQT